jgi:DNA-binding NarL/FixJ family response regulator
MPKPRVIIADDHRLVVAALERLLASECEVVGTAFDGDAVVEQARRLTPDVVLLDISMPPQNGIDIIRRLRLEFGDQMKIVVVTMNDDSAVAAESFRAGACAYVLKNCAAQELVDAVHCAAEGQTYVTPLVAGGMIDAFMKPQRQRGSGEQLTRRQREVLRLLAEGKSMKEVADVLNVAVRTVAFHKYQMMKQLKITTSAELIRFAVAQHIV